MALRLVRLPFRLMVEDRTPRWTELLASRSRRLFVERPPTPTLAHFDPPVLGQSFDDLVDWRAHVGRPESDLRLRWSALDALIHIAWDEPRRQFSVSKRSKHTDSEFEDPRSLWIALITRIISLHGGTLKEVRGVSWRIDLRWPIEATTDEQDEP